MLKRRTWGMTTRLLAAFALLFVVFSHQPPMARALDPVTAMDYVLPDGTVADICFGTDGVSGREHSVPHEKQAPFCDYCRLAGSILLPEQPQASFPVRAFIDVGERAAFQPLFIDNPHPGPRSRAPPFIV